MRPPEPPALRLPPAAGMLLSFMPAEDTFFMLVALMKDPLYGLAEMYAPGLLRFHEVMAVFGRLVAEHAPRLAAHFGALGVEYAMFASQWFITLFTCVGAALPSVPR